MIEKNRPAFEITNVLKWQQDNLGEGTTIVVLDEGLEPHKHMTQQVEAMTFGEVRPNTPKTGHGSGVMAIIHEVAPKARIVYFPFNNVGKEQKMDMLEWIIEHSEEVDIITMSMTWYAPIAREYFDTIKWLKIPFTVASGNDGDISENGVDSPADFDYTLAIGATGVGYTGQASYSNGGKELMCVAPIILAPNATSPEFSRAGTSFSTPFVAGALALYASWRRKNNLPKLTHDMSVQLIKDNAKDIIPKRENSDHKVGFDYPTGWGLFRLPSEVPKVLVEAPKEEAKEPIIVPDTVPSVPEQVPIESEKVGGNLKIIIDAGHGGLDTGGYYRGYREKDINIVVAKRVKELLRDFKPHMIREDDITIIWDKRSAMIKDKYDYCISIHFNMGEGEGVEAIHSAFTTKGKTLATEIVRSINSIAGIPKRPKSVFSKKNAQGQDYYYMHRLTGSTTTVIVECMFLDSPYERDINKLNVEKIAQGIAIGFMNFAGMPVIANPPKVEPVKENPTTIKKYDSFIHVFETTKNMKVEVDLGTRFKLEKVSKIVNDKLAAGEKILAGINCGFFNFDGSNEHIGEHVSKGLYYNPPNINSAELTYYKDGHTEVTNRHGYDQAVLSNIQANAHWSIGTSYSLVKDGKINLMLTEKYAHSKNKEPRTMIGQKADGTFVLAVADGRSSVSKGMTAQEQAEFMLSMGCINAVNLDGGGSSTMVITRSGKPIVYNSPSDGVERSVGSVILVKEV